MAAELDFTLTEQNYVDAARSQFWDRARSPKRWILPLGSLAVLDALLAYSDSCDLQSFFYNLISYVLIILIVCPLVTALIYLSAGTHARKMFRQQSIRPDNHATWDDDGLRVESSIGSLNAKWSDFYGWKKAGRAYLIHVNEALYYLIPGHALSGELANDLEATLVRNGVTRR